MLLAFYLHQICFDRTLFCEKWHILYFSSILFDRNPHCCQRHVLHLFRFSLIETPMLPETCPLPLSNLCDRSNYCGQRHVLHLSRFSLIETPHSDQRHVLRLSRFSVIETPIVGRDMSFTSLDPLWSKPPLWPEPCHSPLSILFDRNPHGGQRHVLHLSRCVLHLSRFSVIEAIFAARDMSFTSLDSLWSKQSLWPDTCPLPLSILCDRSDHCGQRSTL